MSLKLVATTWDTVWSPWDFTTGFPLMNPGRDCPESWGSPERELPPSFLQGYDTVQGSMLQVPTKVVGKLFPDLIVGKLQNYVDDQRRQRSATLRAIADQHPDLTYRFSDPENPESGSDVQRTIRLVRVADLIDGTIGVPVKGLIFAGQRRCYSLPFSVALRLELGIEEPLEIAVENREPETLSDLQEMILLENSRTGQRNYSPQSLLRNACLLMVNEPSIGETKLGSRLPGLSDELDKFGHVTKNNRGQRQRAWLVAKANQRYPELGIADRLRLKPSIIDDGPDKGKWYYVKLGPIPWKRLQPQSIRYLLGMGSDRGTFPKEVSAIYGCEDRNRKATADEFELWLKTIATEGTRSVNYTWRQVADFAANPLIADQTVLAGELLTALCTCNESYFASLQKKGK